MTPYDPREPLPQWGVRSWLLALLVAAGALFWAWVACVFYLVVFAR